MSKDVSQRIRPGVKALIEYQGKILMIQEEINGRIIYDFPGGGIDFGESFEETLHREVMEEVGLKVEIQKHIGNWWFVNSDGVHIVCLAYQCKLIGEPVVDTSKNPASDENIFGPLWLTREEILGDSRKLLKAHGMRAAVENLEI